LGPRLAHVHLTQYAAAERDFRSAFKYAQATSGDEDVDAIQTGSRLGMFLALTSRPKEALTFLEHAKDICLKTKGPDDPFYTPQVFLQYGMALEMAGRPEEALRYISDAVANRRKNRPGTRYLAQMMEDQALVLVDLGRYREAQQLLRESEQIHTKVGVKLNANYLAPRLRLAFAQGELDEAGALLDRYYGLLPDSAALGGTFLSNLENRTQLALRRKDGKSAIALSHQLASAIESSHQQLYLSTWEMRAMLAEGQGRLLVDDPSGALPLFEQALRREEELLDPSSPSLGNATALLGIAHLDLGDRKLAVEFLKKAQSTFRSHPRLSDLYRGPVEELEKRLAVR